MGSLRRLRDAIGVIGIAAVLLTPLVAALAAAFFAPRFVTADEQARAQVSLYEVVGTHTAYELASYVADFQQGLASPEAVQAAARASGSQKPTLGSARLGDSTNVLVTFAAPTAGAAEAGLRAATQVALTSLAEDERDRAQVELQAAVAQLRAPDSGVSWLDAPPEVRERSIQVNTERAAIAVSDAQYRVVLAETVAASVDAIADRQTVVVQTLSTVEDRIRIVVAAAASSLIPVSVLVTMRHRAAARRQGPREVSGPVTSAKSYEASLS